MHTGQWAEIAVLVDDGHLMLVVVFVRGETHGRAPVGVEAWRRGGVARKPGTRRAVRA
ncbi:hypothetical protein GCM10010306_094330 [Streptomyces umbrinus]|nr:hypothetical protein GCM10010306_094330 [Streptomyces umbrinus]